MSEVYDVVISGAGPAGCTCALALGSSGLRVALVDKEKFPRSKVCGDAVAAYVPKVLNTIDPSYALAFDSVSGKNPVDTLRFVAPNAKSIDLEFKEQGSVITRHRFDTFLLDLVSGLSNVTIFQDTLISAITADSSSVKIRTTKSLAFQSKILMGCDGAQGAVRSWQAGSSKIDRNFYAGGVRAYFKHVKGIASHRIELHYLRGLLPFYLWIFPLANGHANVGLGMLSSQLSKRKINLGAELQRMIRQVPHLQGRFREAVMLNGIEGFGLPLGGRKNSISGHRVMLCGDAASLIDPLSGEGIGQAMISGRFAAWHAIECFKKNDFSAAMMLGYDHLVYNKLWREQSGHLRIRNLIAKRPWVINGAVRAGHASKLLLAILRKSIW